jgi:uroporphyrinogen-III synthase
VEYAECYRRVRPESDASRLLASWSAETISGVVATSSEGLRNLCEMIGEAGHSRLSTTTLFVPHPRIAATAAELDLTCVVLTKPGDEGIVDGVVQHFSGAA